MKLYEIWSEGYAATGEQGKAHKHGEEMSTTFQGAIRKHFKGKKDIMYVNKDYTAYWGCKFFDNEEDARKSFG